MLATRASRTGAIDYAHVTRDDTLSLLREMVVILDIERELLADTFTTFDQAYSGAMPLFAKMFVDTKLPWLFGTQAEDEKEKGVIGGMVDLYDKHKRNQARKKE